MLARGELAGESPRRAAARSGRRARARPDALAAAGPIVDEALYTRLFRSVCPVTGQPDYASVQLALSRRRAIDRVGLLCATSCRFAAIRASTSTASSGSSPTSWRRCRPEALAVYARFTRRGGIDINPFRTSGDEPPPPNARTARQ